MGLSKKKPKKTAGEWFTKGAELARLGKRKPFENPFGNQPAYREAIECYDKALEIDPTHFNSWFDKGCVLKFLGDYQKAVECYDMALKINPNHLGSLINKGCVLSSLGKYEEAITCFDDATSIDPNNPGIWHSKGFALGKLGKHKEEIECHAMALSIITNSKKAELARQKANSG
jgi:tetratricopeptide (TPR) repeat protein